MSSDSFDRLASDDFYDSAIEISESLKVDLFDKYNPNKLGFIGLQRNLNEDERQKRINLLVDEFCCAEDFSDLDEKINVLGTNIWKVNQEIGWRIFLDLRHIIFSSEDLSQFPTLEKIMNYLKDHHQPHMVHERLFNLITEHAHMSIKQGHKAQAGEAGKILTKAILKAAGLTHQQHYRTEYKSEGGCDADFAFPHVPNNSDQDLDLIMAVQFSTNDRIRLASAELRAGVRKYLVTYNGIDSSSKTLKEIGDKHIKRCMDENIKIACYEHGLNLEIERLEKEIEKSTEEVIIKDKLQERLSYFKDYACSFKKLAEQIQRLPISTPPGKQNSLFK
ncbi:MAG: hypothetical protein CMH70_02025 [Nitrosomonadaceae bacterium]|nr:hypothetical protein [Nitrosomonadaceae bacterium]|tara:strand:- start:13339 stop:14340 length:1002 start_codon:yes stop_codon:yes gene_type:complete